MADNNSKPLTNNDFRKLIDTVPRQQSATNKQQQQPKPKAKRPAGAHKPFLPSSKKDDDPDAKSRYRDRAAERRKGTSQIFPDDGAFHSDVPGLLSNSSKNTMATKTYEESKFLGGDIEHTHLVKGLDYALLSKIRSENNQEGDTTSNKLQDMTFVTPMGRALYDYFHKNNTVSVNVGDSMGKTKGAKDTIAPVSSINERFLPRRMAFIYTNTALDFEVPTTLHRAKEDCPRPPEVVSLGVDSGVLQRLGKIMAYMRLHTTGGDGRKKSKKRSSNRVTETEGGEEQQREGNAVDTSTLRQGGTVQPIAKIKPSVPEANKEEEEEEEDIFGDAGTDYVVEQRKEKKGDEKQQDEKETANKKRTSVVLFEKDEGDTLMVPKPGQWDKLQEERQKTKEREARRLQMLQSQSNDDGYAECYPEYHDAADDVYESDEEDGDDKEGKGGGEEEGAGDAGDTHKKQPRNRMGKGKGKMDKASETTAKDNAKQQSELSKIQKIFEEKGYSKHVDAFGSDAAKKTDGKDDAMGSETATLVSKKKRRI